MVLAWGWTGATPVISRAEHRENLKMTTPETNVTLCIYPFSFKNNNNNNNIKNKHSCPADSLNIKGRLVRGADVCSRSQQEVTFISDRRTAWKSEPTWPSHKYGREGGQSRQRPRQAGRAMVCPACI